MWTTIKDDASLPRRKNDNELLQEKLKKKESEIGILQTKLKAKEIEIEKAKEEITKYQKKIKEASKKNESEVSRYKAEIRDKDNNIVELNSKISLLQTSLSQSANNSPFSTNPIQPSPYSTVPQTQSFPTIQNLSGSQIPGSPFPATQHLQNAQNINFISSKNTQIPGSPFPSTQHLQNAQNLQPPTSVNSQNSSNAFVPGQNSQTSANTQNFTTKNPNISSEVNHIGSRIVDVSEESGSVLGPITGLINGPLCSFKEALISLKPSVKNLDHFEHTCEFFAELLEEDPYLNSDEIAAIHLYTMEWLPREESLYFLLNKALRERNRTALKPFFPYLRLLLHSMAKLPRFSMETVLWRGVNANLENNYLKSKKKVWWGLSSTTLNMDALSTFLGTSGSRTLFSIQSNYGVEVGKYSAFPAEAEVILFPCVTLQVVNTYSPSEGLLIVQLKECHSPAQFIVNFDTLGK